MEIFKLACPECGADISLDKKTNYCFCPYCGTKFKFDDGIKRSEHTVSYRDEAKLRELELQEEARIREEQRIKQEQEQRKEKELAEAKAKKRSLRKKIIITTLIIFGFLGLANSTRNEKSSSPTTIIDANWYNESAIIVPEIKLKERTKTEQKGPLQYEIPKSWELGDTTVDASYSIYYPKASPKQSVVVSVFLKELTTSTSNFDTDTLNSVMDDMIRKISSHYTLKELKPMMIGDIKGVHAIAKNSNSYPVHIFLVIKNDYWCCILLDSNRYQQAEEHLDEVYYLTQSMKWDFSKDN